jgi:hypothetical protein
MTPSRHPDIERQDRPVQGAVAGVFHPFVQRDQQPPQAGVGGV